MVRLSSLLRQVLQETQKRSVAIETEVDILQKYCELEKLRFGSNVEFSFDVRLEHPEKNVSPLLMMPLVENAIKYGIKRMVMNPQLETNLKVQTLFDVYKPKPYTRRRSYSKKI